MNKFFLLKKKKKKKKNTFINCTRVTILVSNAKRLHKMGKLLFTLLYYLQWCAPGWYSLSETVCFIRKSAVSEERIMKLLTGLNSCKATGLDGLPAKFIIDSAESIVKVSLYRCMECTLVQVLLIYLESYKLIW